MVSYEPDVVSSQRSSNGRSDGRTVGPVDTRRPSLRERHCLLARRRRCEARRRSAFAACLRYRPASIFNATRRCRPFVHCRTAIAAAPYYARRLSGCGEEVAGMVEIAVYIDGDEVTGAALDVPLSDNSPCLPVSFGISSGPLRSIIEYGYLFLYESAYLNVKPCQVYSVRQKSNPRLCTENFIGCCLTIFLRVYQFWSICLNICTKCITFTSKVPRNLTILTSSLRD